MSISSEIARINNEVGTQTDLISQIRSALNGKAAGSGGGSAPVEVSLQEKSVTPTTDVQVVTPDSDYDGLSKVTVEPIPSEYIVPSGTLDVNENGTYDVTGKALVNVNVPNSGGSSSPEILVFTCDQDVYGGHTYENPFISGWTWQDFIESPLNYGRVMSSTITKYKYGMGVSSVTILPVLGGNTYTLCIDGTAATQVLPTDIIQPIQYKTFIYVSPDGPSPF